MSPNGSPQFASDLRICRCKPNNRSSIRRGSRHARNGRLNLKNTNSQADAHVDADAVDNEGRTDQSTPSTSREQFSQGQPMETT